MSQLLCIPFKRSLHVDLERELSEIIDKSFYQIASVFKDDLKTLTRLRSSALEAEISLTGLHTLQNYYLQFSNLKRKFPDQQISFKWFETLGLKSYGREDSRFICEELNIVYNIGALYSLLAADINNGTSEGLKNACIYYRLAAGCFVHIADLLEQMTDPVMEPIAVKSLESLMLAQAQEMVWLKSIKEGLKNNLVAKLALQVSEYYYQSSKCASSSELIRSDWQHRFKQKHLYFKAVALYRYSLSCDDKAHYGYKVRALRDADTTLQTVSQDEEAVCMLISRVKEMLKGAERENDLIYLQPIPVALPNLKPTSMVSPASFEGLKDPLNFPFDKILFKDLLPSYVMESSFAFKKRLDLYIQEYIVDPLISLNKLLSENLPLHYVPGFLQPIEQKELDACQSSIKENTLNAEQIRDVLRQVSMILMQESDTDKLLRERYGSHKWTLEDSREVNNSFWSKHNKIVSFLQTGKAIDAETLQRFDSIDKQLLTAPINLPQSNNPVLNEVLAAFNRRTDYISEVQRKVDDNVILPKIVSVYKRTGQNDFEDVFTEHLKIFRDDLDSIGKEKRVNRELLVQLSEESTKNNNRRLDSVDLYVQDFKHSLKLFNEVKENVQGGNKFYSDLASSSSALLQEVQVFEIERREKKRS
ncbi:LADA_0C05754g1_1 [Lachancea dasiensis]|uniref:LADA_0C05754g1_1 n=1 Tax=Lachancea dasiensis TaxID=1072105 RepID=A0A1G4IZN3_9SACH|nr:LADA_0C05754g1_1 [Lachancea dasiensis]